MDGTQKVIQDYFSQRKVPGELHQCEWKNFGYNRTQAFLRAEHAQRLNKFDYFFVMDADWPHH